MRMAPAALGMLVAIGACALPPAAPDAPAVPPTLAGTRWMGVTQGGSTDPRTLPRLEFVGGGRLSGFTGCNLLSGGWKMEGAEVVLGPLATTKRLCIGPAGDTEKRFLAAIADGGRGRREDDRLVFTGPGGGRFELVEAAAT